ncbi:MAG: exo-alpha-sialidase [Pirellulaceae bacterium]|nr:exo-alpha-sialidase [Pirellulaceae bacterium]
MTPRVSIAAVTLFALSTGSLVTHAQETSRVTVFKNGTEGYNVYRIPTIVTAADGQLLAFCEARVGGDASEIDLVLKRSSDSGATWQTLEVVQESDDFQKYFTEPNPSISVGNPAPVVDLFDPQHRGRLWLPFTLENDRVFVTFSDDHGRQWSSPREITKQVKLDPWGWVATGPVHSIQIQRGAHRGRLVVPADHRLGEDGVDGGSAGAQVLLSDDHGRTWRLGAVDDSYDDDLEANETTVVELNDGKLYFNTRDQNGRATGTRGEAVSSDGGASWQPPTESGYRFFSPAPAVLDPPVVQCALLRFASTLDGANRNMILFCGPDENGPSGPGRSDLRLRYSVDETLTWHDGPLIHQGPAAYSDMVCLDSDRIGILFESGPEGGGKCDRIEFVVYDLSGLEATR